MEPVTFIDPFGTKEHGSAPPAPKPGPVIGPVAGPRAALLFSSQGREREVQRLIHNLAVLAAKQHPSA